MGIFLGQDEVYLVSRLAWWVCARVNIRFSSRDENWLLLTGHSASTLNRHVYWLMLLCCALTFARGWDRGSPLIR